MSHYIIIVVFVLLKFFNELLSNLSFTKRSQQKERQASTAYHFASYLIISTANS